MEQEEAQKKSYLYLLPLFLSVFIFFFRLGTKAFLDYDEAAFSEVVRETLKAHQFASFQFTGQPWFHKPPLFFWLAMIAVQVFPSVEFAMRFVPALSGVGLVMTVYAIAKLETKNRYIALAASLITLSSAGIVDLARQVKIDIPVTLAIVFSYYAYLRGRETKKWLLGIGIGIGVGIMLKSVIGLLVLPLIILNSFFSKDWRWLRSIYLWLGALFSILIVAPWHIYELSIYGNTFWNNYFFGQVVSRFTSNLFSSHLSLMQFTWLFFLNSLPWLLIFLVVCYILAAHIFRYSKTKTINVDENLKASLYTHVCYVIFIFIIFAVSSTRVIYYLAPAYPFIALSVSYGIFAWYERINKRVFYIGMIICFIIAFVSAILFGYRLLPISSGEQHLAEDEKHIGMELRNIPKNQEIYFFSQNYWETVRFYSQGKTVAQFDSESTPHGNFVVVLDSDLKTNLFKTIQYKVMYKGNYVSLLYY